MATNSSDYIPRLEHLLEVCRNLSGSLELEPLLQSLIEAASDLTRSESSSILVYDKESNALRFAAGPWYALDALKTATLPLDRSLAGWVYNNTQPITLHHEDKDKRLFGSFDAELTENMRSILAVPMVFKNETIGVFESVNRQRNTRYSEEDVLILETLAAQAAIAIQNRRLLEEAQRSYQKAVELDRMKSDFIAIASHELRTPLGVIIGHSTFLLETLPEESKPELETIVNSAMRLKEIIEEFSNIDHFEHGMTRLRRGKVNVPALVQDLVTDFIGRAAEKQIALTYEGEQKKFVIDGDNEKIGIILRELIKNALTFTNEKGKVKVRAEQVPGYAKFSVTDTGIGIPATEQTKIFQRFYQVEKHLTRRHGGMGLGLSIAKDMVELHGGRIWVESVEGKGSRFTFLVPANAAQINAGQKVFST